MLKLTMSRRNLETLLNKLDRNLKEPGASACTLLLPNNVPDGYGYTEVEAVENEVKYGGRDIPPGPVHPADDFTR